eukprot:scaffold315303_cov30-Tisochrysis_lutea.AAC.2
MPSCEAHSMAAVRAVSGTGITTSMSCLLAHPQPCAIDGDTIDDRVRPRKVNVFEHAGRVRARWRRRQAVLQQRLPTPPKEQHVPGRHVAKQLKAESIERAAL